MAQLAPKNTTEIESGQLRAEQPLILKSVSKLCYHKVTKAFFKHLGCLQYVSYVPSPLRAGLTDHAPCSSRQMPCINSPMYVTSDPSNIYKRPMFPAVAEHSMHQ